MTDHDPDKQLTCYAYCGIIGGVLVVFFFGVYIGYIIA